MLAAQALGAAGLSTTSIIVAALCEAFENVRAEGSTCKVISMSANMRGRDPESKGNGAGNYVQLVNCPAHEGRNPTFIRALFQDRTYYSHDGDGRISESPARECMENCDHLHINSLASVTCAIEPPGTKVLCHIPSNRGWDTTGIKTTLIWKADNDGTIAVRDNYFGGKRRDEVSKHLALCKSYSRLFRPLQSHGQGVCLKSSL